MILTKTKFSTLFTHRYFFSVGISSGTEEYLPLTMDEGGVIVSLFFPTLFMETEGTIVFIRNKSPFMGVGSC